MGNTNNIQHEGFCPWNGVNQKLSIADRIDKRLLGLWSIFGGSVVCSNESAQLTVDPNAVIEMFTTDTIAYQLMVNIVRRNPSATRIRIFQTRKGSGCSNMQTISCLQETLMSGNLVNPVLILEANSKYAVILATGESEEIIDLHIWNLAQCC